VNPDRPNIALQRTAPCGLAAERRSLGSPAGGAVFGSILVVMFCLMLAEQSSGATAVFSFVETNSAGQRIRELAVDLSDAPATTCLGGAWRVARIVKDPKHYMRHPAYTLEKGRLEVLLINGPCDSYDSYIGEISGGSFRGDHVAYGLGFSKTLGRVTGGQSK